jgi:DNA-binding helix-hairpin-helix protein with protein kinase domain
MRVFLEDGTPVKLSSQKLGDGGEGAVYLVDSNPKFIEKCVKIYTKPKPEQHEKIKFMVKNTPSFFDNDGCKICWPERIIYDRNKNFIGFMMPCAYPNSVTLNRFISLGRKVPWINKYDLKTDSGLRRRIGLCKNIARVFYFIHRANFYVVGDVKPHNILLDENCNISLVDLDSIQIIDTNKGVKFFTLVASAEYAAPEVMREIMKNTGNTEIHITADKFSIALLFYFILVGIHPYAVSPKNGGGSGQNSIHELIKNGYYAHGKRANDIYKMNLLHNNVHQLPSEIQELFKKNLCGGVNDTSKRAPASIWGELFSTVLNDSSSHKLVTNSKLKAMNRVIIPKKKLTTLSTLQSRLKRR